MSPSQAPDLRIGWGTWRRDRDAGLRRPKYASTWYFSQYPKPADIGDQPRPRNWGAQHAPTSLIDLAPHLSRPSGSLQPELHATNSSEEAARPHAEESGMGVVTRRRIPSDTPERDLSAPNRWEQESTTTEPLLSYHV